MKRSFLIITTIPTSLIFFKGQIEVLKRGFDVEIVTNSGGSLELFAKNEGVKFHIVNIERDIAILTDLMRLFDMSWLFLEKNLTSFTGVRLRLD